MNSSLEKDDLLHCCIIKLIYWCRWLTPFHWAFFDGISVAVIGSMKNLFLPLPSACRCLLFQWNEAPPTPRNWIIFPISFFITFDFIQLLRLRGDARAEACISARSAFRTFLISERSDFHLATLLNHFISLWLVNVNCNYAQQSTRCSHLCAYVRNHPIELFD